jgi:hypothetical protein
MSSIRNLRSDVWTLRTFDPLAQTIDCIQRRCDFAALVPSSSASARPDLRRDLADAVFGSST